jgi:hypothetical protein
MRNVALRVVLSSVGLFLLMSSPSWAFLGTTVIDDFQTAQAQVSAPAGTTDTSVAGSVIVGGHRELNVSVIAPGSPTSPSNDVTAQVVTGTGLVFTSASATQGEVEVRWDATSTPGDSLAPIGLSGADFTTGGADSLKLTVSSASAGTLLLFEVWTDATRSSTRALVLPAVGTTTDFILPFSSFAPNRGTGALFNAAGAIRLFIRGTNANVTLTQIVCAQANAQVTATLTDNATQAMPGDTLHYTATLQTGGGTSTGVTYNDILDANTTSTGTVRVSPIALDDAYVSATTSVSVAAPGVLQNDVDALGLTMNASTSSSVTSLGGSVTLNANGSFTYTPPANAQGRPDAFVYTLADTASVADSLVDTAVATITVTGQPVLTAGATLNYTEGDPATVIDNTITVADVDSTQLSVAFVQITAGYANGEDVLGFTNTASITGTFDTSTGTLTLAGSDTLANYQAALRSVTYRNTSANPSTATRTVSWTAADELMTGNTVTSTIQFTGVNDAPVLSAGGTLNYNENDPATPIDPTITASDADSANLVGATAVISANYVNGEDLLSFTNTANITGSFNAATGTLTLAGSDSVANYQTALRNVKYANASDSPSTAARTITWRVDDGSAQSNLSNQPTSTVNVTPVDDAPFVTAGNTLLYTENDAPAAASSALTVTDVDSTTLSGATVQVTGNYVNGEDVLALPAPVGGITAVFVPATGTLALAGVDNLANYQTALRSVTYFNASDNPSALARTLTWVANDGTASSVPATSTVSVTPVNDPPANALPAAPTMNQGAVLTMSGGNAIQIADIDAGVNPVQVTLTGTNGNLTLSGTAGLSFSAGDGTDDAIMTFTGTIAAINTALAGMTFTPPAGYSGPATIEIVTNDQGFTGSGGPQSDDDTLNITVQPANQAPVNTVPATQTVNEDGTLVFSAANTNQISTSDVDAASDPGVQITVAVLQGRLHLIPTAGVTINNNDTLTVTATGAITDLNTALNGLTYTPNLNYNGTDTLTFTTNDNGATGPGGAKQDQDTVTINITAVNDAPVITRPATASASEDTTFTFNGGNVISVADLDGASGSETVTLGASHGVLNLASLVGLTVSGNGTGSVTASGALTDLNSALNGLTYLPDLDYTGGDTLSIGLNDNGNTGTGGPASDSKTTAITVGAVNDAPVNSVPGTQTFDEDTTLTFSSSNANAITVSDVDAAGGNETVTLTTTAGTLTFGSVAGLSAVTNNAASITGTGTLAAINAALNGLVFTPTLNINGAQTISITTNDNGNTGSGGAKSDTDPINLSITAVNDAPVIARPAAVSPVEDTPFTFNGGNAISIADVDAGAGTVTVALSVSSGALTLSGTAGLVFNVGANGTSAMTFSGTLTNINNALAGMAYLSSLDFNGSDTLTIDVNDNGNTGTGGPLGDSKATSITVTAVNDAPVNSVPGTQTFDEDTTLTFSAGNGNAISVSDVDAGSANVTVTLTTTAGTMVFGTVAGLSAVTNNAASITGTGTLTSVNAALQGLVFTPTLNLNGAQTISLTTNDNGNTGSGGAKSDTDPINLTINAVNDAPTVTAPGSIAATEDTAKSITTVSVADIDGGTNPEKVTLGVSHGKIALATVVGITFVDGTANNSASLHFTGTLAALNNALNGMTYTPDPDFNDTRVAAPPTDTLAITINDQGNTGSGGPLSASANPTITVAAVNDPPVAAAKAYTVQANMKANITGLLTGATDADNGDNNGAFTSIVTLNNINSTSCSGGPTGCVVSNINAAAGSFDFLPPAGFTGTITITYQITDNGNPGSATSAAQNIVITVNGPVIWFVDCSGPSGDGRWDGTNGHAFSTLGPAPAGVDNVDAANHRVFVVNSTCASGLALNSGEWLIGQGVTGAGFQAVMGTAALSGATLVTPPAINGTRPILQRTITLAPTSKVVGLDINTSSVNQPALTNAGNTVNGVVVDVGAVNSGSGVAVNISGANNGAGIANSMSFVSVSSNGASSGISLANETGTFTISGNAGSCSTAANCTGGAIQNTTGAGISLTSTNNVSIDRLFIQNTGDSGVKGTGVVNFAFTNGRIDNSGTTLGADMSNIGFNATAAGTENNLSGTVTITGNTLTNAYYNGIDIFNFNGTISDANISSNALTSSVNGGAVPCGGTPATCSKGSGIRFIAFGSAGTIANVTKATIANNTVTNFPAASGIQAQGGNGNAVGPAGTFGTAGSATNLITITNNTVQGPSVANRIGAFGIATVVNGKGQGNFDVSNNPTVTNTIGQGITNSSLGLANVTANFNNNVIAPHNSAAAPGLGSGTSSTFGSSDTPTLSVTITNNNISQMDGNGILSTARDATGTLKIGIRGNTVGTPLSGVRPGIRVDAGNGISVDENVCADVSSNTVSVGSGGSAPLGVRKQGVTATTNDFGIEGLAPSPATCSQAEARVSSQNPATTATGSDCLGTGTTTALVIAGSNFVTCATAP